MSVAASGTKTVAVSGTPEDLATITDPGTYEVHLNLTNLANGEQYTLRLFTKVLSTSTEEKEVELEFGQEQDSPNVASGPVRIEHSLRAEVQQNGGTMRAVEWSVNLYD